VLDRSCVWRAFVMVRRSNRSETLDGLEINLERKDARSHPMCVAKIASWTLAAAIIILSVVPPSLRPETGVPHELEHFLIYAITGFAFGIAYELQYAALAILLALFAGSVEIAQLFIPGRHARLSDFIVDAIAMCAGAIAVMLRPRPVRAISQIAQASAAVKIRPISDTD
jgi:VanZ family protein